MRHLARALIACFAALLASPAWAGAPGEITDVLALAGSIDLGNRGFVFTAAVDETRNRAYVGLALDPDPNVVAVVDLASNSVVDTIATDALVWQLAVDPAANRLYVATFEPDGRAGALVALDATTHRRLAELDFAGAVLDVAVDRASNRIYALVDDYDACQPGPTPPAGSANARSRKKDPALRKCAASFVHVVDGATHAVTDRIALPRGGGFPFELALDPDAHRLYAVTDGISDETGGVGLMTVINTKGNNVIASGVPVGRVPAGIAVDPVTRHVYVPSFHFEDLTTTVLAAPSNHVVASIPAVSWAPVDAAVDPAHGRVYVASPFVVDGVDAATSRVVASHALKMERGFYYGRTATNPVTGRLYLPVVPFFCDSSCPTALDVLMPTKHLTLPGEPIAAAIDPGAHRMYVLNNFSGGLTVVDTRTKAILATIPGGGGRAFAVNPVTNRAYVTSVLEGRVVVVDLAAQAVVAAVGVGRGGGTRPFPIGVAVDVGRNRVYVANSAEDGVAVLDGATDSLVTTLPVGGAPVAVAYDPGTDHLFVASRDSSTVTVIDGASHATVATIALRPRSDPTSLAVNGRTGRLYVGNERGFSVTTIDTATSAVVGTLQLPFLGGQPTALAVDEAGDKTYVALYPDGVGVIDGPSGQLAWKVTPDEYAGNGAFGVAFDPETRTVFAPDLDSGVIFFEAF